jgi:anti-sigma regulatory factor (Ser/Thr protein kinase)
MPESMATANCLPGAAARGACPVDGQPSDGRPGGDVMTGTQAAARVFPGRRECTREARRWVRTHAAAACPAAAEEAETGAGELFPNAVRHTRSGAAGGTVTVAVTASRDGVTVHVHDLGADGGQLPCPGPSGDSRGLATSGRGLLIVAAISAEWGTTPAVWCPAGGHGDPAAAAGGCCTWFRLAAVPARRAVR